ncbi:hypothetical protein B0H19DRAFT_1116329 [Mycena capillaripes]|nr:hypothetical protein B0H19DRAFT_1116329 [Mycena capillaripes]
MRYGAFGRHTLRTQKRTPDDPDCRNSPVHVAAPKLARRLYAPVPSRAITNRTLRACPSGHFLSHLTNVRRAFTTEPAPTADYMADILTHYWHFKREQNYSNAKGGHRWTSEREREGQKLLANAGIYRSWNSKKGVAKRRLSESRFLLEEDSVCAAVLPSISVKTKPYLIKHIGNRILNVPQCWSSAPEPPRCIRGSSADGLGSTVAKIASLTANCGGSPRESSPP